MSEREREPVESSTREGPPTRQRFYQATPDYVRGSGRGYITDTPVYKTARTTTLAGRPIPATWSIGELPDSEYLSLRYLSTRGMIVVETIRPYGEGEQTREWHHVSVSWPDHLPTWDDLGMVKRLWMGTDTTAYIILPPTSRYVNEHKFCLHLWRCLEGDVTPEFAFVLDGRWVV